VHRILKLILHLFFWCTYILFAGLISFRLSEGFGYLIEYKWIFVANAVWAAIAFYFHYLALFKYISEKQLVKYLLYSFLVCVTVSVLFFAAFKFMLFRNDPSLELLQFFPPLIGTFIIGNCGSLLRGFIDWFNQSAHKAELEKQSLTIELELLRSQLNHHFLFNTLNNIDTLIFKDQHKASDALIALSSILRYMLYETRTEKVPLNKEVENIWHIVHLEQLRVATPNYTRLTVEGETSDVLVPPLLFVPFIENAYKHSSYKGNLPVIDIHFQHTDGTMKFKCSNYKDKLPKETHKPGNLGLKNIERRLNLLYGNNCKFEIDQNESTFNVIIEIPC
jgi:two-component system, LytTR family, sensor kinase